mmetsp:Transcript_15179/g.49401  ORF Transcript_15179/g.49401 Transcript_15179/m.49401 type:complete len:219 (+) Transcript_15179:1992-2648(+)
MLWWWWSWDCIAGVAAPRVPPVLGEDEGGVAGSDVGVCQGGLDGVALGARRREDGEGFEGVVDDRLREVAVGPRDEVFEVEPRVVLDGRRRGPAGEVREGVETQDPEPRRIDVVVQVSQSELLVKELRCLLLLLRARRGVLVLVLGRRRRLAAAAGVSVVLLFRRRRRSLLRLLVRPPKQAPLLLLLLGRLGRRRQNVRVRGECGGRTAADGGEGGEG